MDAKKVAYVKEPNQECLRKKAVYQDIGSMISASIFALLNQGLGWELNPNCTLPPNAGVQFMFPYSLVVKIWNTAADIHDQIGCIESVGGIKSS